MGIILKTNSMDKNNKKGIDLFDDIGTCCMKCDRIAVIEGPDDFYILRKHYTYTREDLKKILDAMEKW